MPRTANAPSPTACARSARSAVKRLRPRSALFLSRRCAYASRALGVAPVIPLPLPGCGGKERESEELARLRVRRARRAGRCAPVLLGSSSLRRFGCASWRVERAECSRLSGIGAANKGGQARANVEKEPLSRSGSRLTGPRSPGPNAPFTMTSSSIHGQARMLSLQISQRYHPCSSARGGDVQS
jgi:hypothetical protein